MPRGPPPPAAEIIELKGEGVRFAGGGPEGGAEGVMEKA